jgi:hypothetical protein
MEKHASIFLVVLVTAGFLISCKKDNKAKDYSVSIKDKTWWGRLTYSGQTTEYYCVHFRSDGSLLWSQLSDDYEGHWTLKGKQLVMNFNANSAEIKADISNDDKLMNIMDNTGYYEVNSGQMLSNSSVSLENTVWKGDAFTPNSGKYSMQLNFLPGTKTVLYLGNSSHPAYTYTRSESGAVIRTVVDGSYHIFCILTSGIEMIGTNTTADYPFQITKQ